MIIRKAKIKDIPQTSKLGYKLNQYHAKFDRYYLQSKNALKIFKDFHRKSIYSPKSLFLVAEDNNKIVGYAIGKIDSRPKVYKVNRMGFILAIYVKREYRRQGISKKFIEKIFAWFKLKKIKYVELHVHGKNDPAVKTWMRYKFKTFLLHQRLKL